MEIKGALLCTPLSRRWNKWVHPRIVRWWNELWCAMVVRFSSSHSSTLENDVGRSKGRDDYSRVPFVTKVQTLSTWGNNETPVALGKTRISCTMNMIVRSSTLLKRPVKILSMKLCQRILCEWNQDLDCYWQPHCSARVGLPFTSERLFSERYCLIMECKPTSARHLWSHTIDGGDNSHWSDWWQPNV